VARDDAGNRSDVKIISIKISESGEAAVTDEGTEVLPQETVLGEQSEEEEARDEQGPSDGEQVAGDETAKDDSPSAESQNWPYGVAGLIIALIAGFWWRARKRRPGMQI
jgi:LPXTG-motif cell wall-anchored protein